MDVEGGLGFLAGVVGFLVGLEGLFWEEDMILGRPVKLYHSSG